MKKRCVLILGEGQPRTGGIATVIHDQFASSLSQSFDLVLFDTRKRTRPRRTIVEGVIAQSYLLLTYVLKLLTLKPDLVHVHAGGGADIYRKGWDVLLAKICRRRVLLHIHGGDFDQFFKSGNQRNLNRVQKIFRRCNRVIALSEYWRSLYVRILDGEKVSVVNNCINLELYRSIDRDAARQALNLPSSARVVLHLGSQGIRKGTFDLIRIVPRVLEVEPKLIVILVGPDENVHPGAIGEGQALVDELGISHAVRFLGAQTGRTKIECLGAADLFVLPSYNENFPISILEAMACGLPVISTKVGGIPEMLCDTAPEDLIEPGDWSGLAERIIAYVSNPGLCKETGQRNQIAAQQRFNLESFAQNLTLAYKTACES